MPLTRTVELLRTQQDFRRSPNVYRGFVGGRGSGKTWVGAYDLFTRAKPGRLYMVGGPTYKVLKDVTLRTFRDIGRSLGLLASLNKSDLVARLTNGAEVLFRSADDPEHFRGPNLSGCWLDEASLMGEEAWNIVIACLREAGEQGWCSATFTPKGRSHWTYQAFGTGRLGAQLFKAKTIDNPFNPPGFVAQLLTQYSGLRARQELEGEFLDIEGAEWPGTYFPASMWFKDWPSKLAIKILSLDPSKGKSDKKGDYAAFVMVGLDYAGHLWIDASLDRIPTPMIAQAALSLYRQWQPTAIVVETNQFQELLAHEIVRVSKEMGFTPAIYGLTNMINKQVRIRTLGPYLARGETHFREDSPGAALLVQQLQEFPEAEHDDGPDALEMAVRMMHWLLAGGKGPGSPDIIRAA